MVARYQGRFVAEFECSQGHLDNIRNGHGPHSHLQVVADILLKLDLSAVDAGDGILTEH